MKVLVRAYGEARELIGGGSRFCEVKGDGKVKDLFDGLGLDPARASGWLILLNGKDIRRQNGWQTPLAAGDEIDLIPPARGGC